MILLADGGSTKVDWRLLDGEKEIKKLSTGGINPYFHTTEEINEELKKSVLPAFCDYNITSVYFYGAGCTPEKKDIIRDALTNNLHIKEVYVDSDLLAAARGLCGRDKGIACILGTGSNSCYYDGEKITDNVSPLGYILGDEGSGAVLGKLFIGACLKNQLAQDIREAFLDEYGLTSAMIIEKVYRRPLANRLLASFAPFILKYIDNESVYNLVYVAFNEFFVKNVMQYDYKNNLVHFTGSVAYHFRDILHRVGEDLDIEIGIIAKSPMERLIKHHSK